MSDDPILEVLDDLLENGDEAKIPSRVSNRLLLAASVKSIRYSKDNKDAIDRNLRVVDVHFKEIETVVTRNAKFIYGLTIMLAVLASLLGAHLGGVKIPFVMP
jgi:hypothetical protein